jgi:hypothetical protein
MSRRCPLNAVDNKIRIAGYAEFSSVGRPSRLAPEWMIDKAFDAIENVNGLRCNATAHNNFRFRSWHQGTVEGFALFAQRRVARLVLLRRGGQPSSLDRGEPLLEVGFDGLCIGVD